MASSFSNNQVRRGNGRFVQIFCLFTIIFEGYDVVVYGATVPSLLEHNGWNVGVAQAGVIGSLALIGMMIGTMIVGPLTDLYGRRRVLLASTLWFSLCMLATSLSPDETIFTILRFLTGVGMGTAVPICISMTVEFAPKSGRQFANAVMYSGFSVGGVLASVIGIVALPHLDFRWLYALGSIAVITIVPIGYRYLPESIAFQAARGLTEQAKLTAERCDLVYEDIVTEEPASRDEPGGDQPRGLAMKELFTPRWLRGTTLFSMTMIASMVVVYGLTTWLPEIMRSAGFALGGALSFLLVLNLGAIVGVITLSRVADKVGVQKVTIAGFIIACCSVFLMSFKLPIVLLYVLIALTGLGSIGTQILLVGFIATHYTQRMSTTGLGWALSVGRIGAIAGPVIVGLVASMALGYQINFYMFSSFALLAAVFVAAVATRKSRKKIASKTLMGSVVDEDEFANPKV